ncbi:GAF domain-containing protein [Rhizobium leguminosarum]|nr:GAF domain-containing protein [Rhizobium leguminosarum]NKK61353.1 GAF domain-containing protein [Rhizobium leguminosarum bv. viciae]
MTIMDEIESSLLFLPGRPVVSWRRAPGRPTIADADASEPTIGFSHDRDGDDAILTADISYFAGAVCEVRIPGAYYEIFLARLQKIVLSAVIRFQNRAVQAMNAINRNVLDSLDPNEINVNAIEQTLSVIAESDAGVLRLYDEASGLLIPVSQVGFDDDYYNYRVTPQESIAGSVFSTGTPVLLNSPEDIRDAHANLRAPNVRFLSEQGISHSLICVPIKTDTTTLGTLTVMSFRPGSAYGEFSVSLLAAVATQLAIAYKKSQAYELAVRSNESINRMRLEIERRNAELARSLSAHDDILSIFTRHRPLGEHLEEIATHYGIDFHYADIFGTTFVSREWKEPKAMEDMPVGLFDGSLSQREDLSVQPVRVADDVVGSFHFERGDNASYSAAILGVVSAFVALEIVRSASQDDILNSKRRKHFEALGRDDLVTSGGAVRFGFQIKKYCQIIFVRHEQESAQNQSLFLQRTLQQALRAATIQNQLSFYTDEGVFLLFCAATEEALRKNLEPIGDKATAEGWRCGASLMQSAPHRYPEAANQAVEAAHLMSMRHRAGILVHSETGIDRLLRKQSAADILEFADQILAPIEKEANGDALLRTLEIYIESGKSASKAAASLGIHTNTLYQRLQRAQHLMGKDIDNKDDYLLLSLAFHLKSTYGSQQPAGRSKAASA